MTRYDAKIDIWTRDQAKTIDALTSSKYGVSSLSLMEQAGKSVADFLLTQFGPDTEFVMVCGPGNNGGDALVAANYLYSNKRKTHTLIVRDKASSLSGACQYQLDNFKAGEIRDFSEDYIKTIGEGAVLVDGLLGIGQAGELREGLYKNALKFLASRPWQKVVAVDIPSGIEADRWGQSAILKADFTISFGARKPAHCFYPSKSSCGDIFVVELNFSTKAITDTIGDSPVMMLDGQLVRSLDPWQGLKSDAHKYERGHVLIIGGSKGKQGAPVIAASAAFYAGAGWVSLALLGKDEIQKSIPLEITMEDFSKDDVLDFNSVKNFIVSRKVRALCIGPGMVSSPFTDKNWDIFLEITELLDVCIVDAGALIGLGLLMDRKPMSGNCLLTPHPGEWLKIHPENKRIDDCKELEKAKSKINAWGVEVFYKTGTPFTIGRQNPTLVNHEADVSIAKAGTGDLLAGLSACLGMRNRSYLLGNICQSYVAWVAEQRKRLLGSHGLSASDIARYISTGF